MATARTLPPSAPTTSEACCARKRCRRPERSGKPALCRMTPCVRSRTVASQPPSPNRRASACAPPPTANTAAPTGTTTFVAGLDGVEIYEPEEKIFFTGGVPLTHKLRVNGPIAWSQPTMIDHFQFLASHVRTSVPKQTIPSPSVVHFRGGRDAIDQTAYPTMEPFFADLGAAYNKAVAAFGAAGCRYLQLDEVNIAYLCDPEQIAMLKKRGEHVDNLLNIYADMLNQAVADKPDGMTISMHLCRGNFRSTWVASGGYEPVAEILFNRINSDAYFMEYDTDRAGGFEPLRFVPRGPKIVVLGIMTSKTGELESKDELKRRIDEAAKYLPWNNSPCHRNAASPRPRKATPSPRTSNGPNSPAASKSPRKSGAASDRHPTGASP